MAYLLLRSTLFMLSLLLIVTLLLLVYCYEYFAAMMLLIVHSALFGGISGAHTDYGMLTILATDDTPGLQIQLGGKWIDVPPERGMFIINIGDLTER